MIAYASRTGNVKYVVDKLKLPSVNIKDVEVVEYPFILFTYTDGLGLIPPLVEEFLLVNHSKCVGIIASGNKNFGNNNFCGSADKINYKYGIPIIRKLDLRGQPSDYDYIIEEYNKLFGGE